MPFKQVVLFSPRLSGGKYRLTIESFPTQHQKQQAPLVLVHLDAVQLSASHELQQAVSRSEAAAAARSEHYVAIRARALNHIALDLLALGGKYFIPSAATPVATTATTAAEPDAVTTAASSDLSSDAQPAPSDIVDEFAAADDHQQKEPQHQEQQPQEQHGDHGLVTVARASFLFNPKKIPILESWFLNSLLPGFATSTKLRWMSLTKHGKLKYSLSELPSATGQLRHVQVDITSTGSTPVAIHHDLRMLGGTLHYKKSDAQQQRSVFIFKRAALSMLSALFNFHSYASARGKIIQKSDSGSGGIPNKTPPLLFTLGDKLALRGREEATLRDPMPASAPLHVRDLQLLLQLGGRFDAATSLFLFDGFSFKHVLAFAKELKTISSSSSKEDHADGEQWPPTCLRGGGAVNGTVPLHKPVGLFYEIRDSVGSNTATNFWLDAKPLADGDHRPHRLQQRAMHFTIEALGGKPSAASGGACCFEFPAAVRGAVSTWLTKSWAVAPFLDCIYLKTPTLLKTVDPILLMTGDAVKSCIAMGGRFVTIAGKQRSSSWLFEEESEQVVAEYAKSSTLPHRFQSKKDWHYRRIVLDAMQHHHTNAAGELRIRLSINSEIAGALRRVAMALGGKLLQQQSGVNSGTKAAMFNSIWSFSRDSKIVAESFFNIPATRASSSSSSSTESAAEESSNLAPGVVSVSKIFEAASSADPGKEKKNSYVVLCFGAGNELSLLRNDFLIVNLSSPEQHKLHWRALLRCGGMYMTATANRPAGWSFPSARWGSVARWALKLASPQQQHKDDIGGSSSVIVEETPKYYLLKIPLRQRVADEACLPVAEFLSFVPIHQVAKRILFPDDKSAADGAAGSVVINPELCAGDIFDCSTVGEDIVLSVKPTFQIAMAMHIHPGLGVMENEENSAEAFLRAKLHVAQRWSNLEKTAFGLVFQRLGGRLSCTSGRMSNRVWLFPQGSPAVEYLQCKWVLKN